jgi:hypothetical protein
MRTGKDWKGLQVHRLELEFLPSQYLSIAKMLEFQLTPKNCCVALHDPLSPVTWTK